jgi:hypothetical protein
MVLCGAAAGCGSTITTTPTDANTAAGPFANIAGTWSGTLESGNVASRTIKMIVVQSGNCVDGVWDSSPAEWTGAISGIATADSYIGQMSLEVQANDGTKCAAVGNVTGPVMDPIVSARIGSTSSPGCGR